MQAVPQLSNIRQVSDGWIKKYVLAYTMPDGSTYEYESASRKSLDAYRAELEGNAAGRACAADAVCIVQQRHEVRCAALRWIGHALRFQHGIEHRGHPQPVVDKSRIHAVESALHHNGYRDDGQAVIEPLWMRKSGPTRNRRSPCIGFAGLAQSSFAIWARALSICSWTSMPTMSSPSAATKRTSGMPNILAMPTMYS